MFSGVPQNPESRKLVLLENASRLLIALMDAARAIGNEGLAGKLSSVHFALSEARELDAQVGEARRAETALAGSVHEHAVAEGDAPSPKCLP